MNPIINKKLLLNDLLKDFFNIKEISEFSKNLIDKVSEVKSSKRNLTGKSKEQIDIELNEGNFRTGIDLLITFAESRLVKTKFFEFLLSLGQLTITAGEFALAIDINEKILNQTKNESEYDSINANAYFALADLLSRQAQWQLCFNIVKKAISIFQAIKDRKGIAKCNNLLGTVYGDLGDLKKAKGYFEECLNFLEKEQDKVLSGKVEINLGIINNIQGNFDLALSYYRRALLNFEKISDNKRIAEIRHNMGMTFLKKNEFDAAISDFDKSISHSLQAGFLPTLGITYVSKAYAYTLMNDFTLAEAFSDKAMEICYKTNDKLSIAEIYKVKGIIQKHLSNYQLSENFLLTSLRINKEHTNRLNEAETYYELGLLYKEMNKKPESKNHFNEALKYFKRINAVVEIKIIQELIAE